jgi:UDP-N-acetylmuramyl pentapeptide phosphotransferase/UDP-N-acetylglucosamine-1-phosphate transferase
MQKTHRVGTITLGGMLIVFGILFLLRLFFVGITYELIFRLWPIIFLFLGGEVLIANFRQKDEKMVYDKTAIVILVILSFFAMGMAVVDFCLTTAHGHLTIY